MSSQQWTYRFLLERYHFWTVEEALSYCQTLSEQGQAPDTPFWTDGNDVKAIDEKLWRSLVMADIRGEILNNPSIHKNYGMQMDVELEEKDMMAFDAMLSCFQAHCREQMAQGIKGLEVHVELIDDIREEMWASPPSADE